ncbi:unnamed protein product [Caenorhabditis auriculariae]|uniref:Uncharacterized protein n=1 Tax=Caenorhabditis auriculariae TaxID=2777116 RepID=A0A8S1HB45_9PELO|nr:unnamed protein product [Caenorhabditis auriculariae]
MNPCPICFNQRNHLLHRCRLLQVDANASSPYGAACNQPVCISDGILHHKSICLFEEAPAQSMTVAPMTPNLTQLAQEATTHFSPPPGISRTESTRAGQPRPSDATARHPQQSRAAAEQLLAETT